MTMLAAVAAILAALGLVADARHSGGDLLSAAYALTWSSVVVLLGVALYGHEHCQHACSPLTPTVISVGWGALGLFAVSVALLYLGARLLAAVYLAAVFGVGVIGPISAHASTALAARADAVSAACLTGMLTAAAIAVRAHRRKAEQPAAEDDPVREGGW